MNTGTCLSTWAQVQWGAGSVRVGSPPPALVQFPSPARRGPRGYRPRCAKRTSLESCPELATVQSRAGETRRITLSRLPSHQHSLSTCPRVPHAPGESPGQGAFPAAHSGASLEEPAPKLSPTFSNWWRRKQEEGRVGEADGPPDTQEHPRSEVCTELVPSTQL